MKIAHLDSGREWRGGQAQTLLLMRGLKARGHECLLLAPEGPLHDRALAAGLTVERWVVRNELDMAAMVTAERWLRRFGPVLVHAHSAHAHALGVPAARRARVPGVVVSRRVDFAVGGNPFSRIKYRLPVDRYLCISRGILEVLRSAGIPEAQLALVPSGIELKHSGEEIAAAVNLRGLIGVPPAAPVVGTVAALAPHKDHRTLLEAAARVIRERPPVQFVWIGEGECRAALERRRRELDLDHRIHMLGFRDDARALIPQFSVFALSSHLEGLCTSLLDAQAFGVPVVATRTGGIPDVVEDGVTGRLVPPGEPLALAGGILEALARPDLAHAWAARAKESVRAFSIDRTVELTIEQYRAVLREHGIDA